METPSHLNDPWFQEQLSTASRLAGNANQALRRNQFEIAKQLLSEADAVLDMSEYDDADALLELRAQVYNEFGFLEHRLGNLEAAQLYHRRSAETGLTLLDRGVAFRPNTTASLINLAGVLAQDEQTEEGLRRITQATELISSYLSEHPENEEASFLGFGAYHLRATLLLLLDQPEEADKAATQSLEYSKKAGEEIGPKLQVANGFQQFAVQCFQKEELDLAIKWGGISEDLAREAFEIEREPAIPVFVQTQLFLILFHENKGNYSAAEDALFNAIDVIGNHPQLLHRGRHFYIQAKKQTDKRLEDGGLPRPEVEEGLQEILKRIEAFGGEEKLMETLKELGVEEI